MRTPSAGADVGGEGPFPVRETERGEPTLGFGDRRESQRTIRPARGLRQRAVSEARAQIREGGTKPLRLGAQALQRAAG